MDESQYTEWHTHVDDTELFEMVAYERIDGGWDVFVYEPVGAVPELEAGRVDEGHILIGNVPLNFLSPEETQKPVGAYALGEEPLVVDFTNVTQLAQEVEARLWADYHQVVFYEEMGERRIIQRILEHLERRGAHGMRVGSHGHNRWLLHIRNKDVPIASEVITSNIGDKYQYVLFYVGEKDQYIPLNQEENRRHMIQRIMDHLRRQNTPSRIVYDAPNNKWLFYVYKKDVPLASEVVASNVPQN